MAALLGNLYQFRAGVEMRVHPVPTATSFVVLRTDVHSLVRARYELPLRAEFPRWISRSSSNPDMGDSLRQPAVQRNGLRARKGTADAPHGKNSTLLLDVVYVLAQNDTALTVRVELHNNEHQQFRLGVALPLPFKVDEVRVGAQFDVFERPITAESTDADSLPFDAFFGVAANATRDGILVAARGLHEYRASNVRDSTLLSLTLMRSVSELGDWGTFEVPSGHAAGLQEFEFALIPFSNGHYVEAETRARNFGNCFFCFAFFPF